MRIDDLEPDRLCRILIVDDEEAHVRALRDTLPANEYETFGFTDPAAALSEFRADRFDLLLCDLMMPGMNGITFLQSAHEIDPEIVAIIMTGHGTIATAVQAMKSGALDYILKPFNLSEILPVLHRARAVRRLRMRNFELERQLRERAAELVLSNRELDAFAHSVSHDLRSPLHVIIGFTELLGRDPAVRSSPNALELLGDIQSGGWKMVKLIGNLLRFARLSRDPLSTQAIAMTALVQETLEETRKEYPERRVEVMVAELPDCVADPALLTQVMANLLSNAFKYTARREDARVEIGGERDEHETRYFVRDNGAGFDMRQAEFLFGDFKRLHADQEFRGTGVGLSLAHRIIARHGGRIWAEAEIDRGATFSFALPNTPP